jgi:hypothetical protein
MVEYNSAFMADETPDKRTVTSDIETSDWRPITPLQRDALYETLLFTDGSRRTEARVLLEDERKQVAFGALGSFAIGCVSCCARGSRQAQFVDMQALGMSAVQRVCTLSSGYQLAHFELVSPFVQYLGKLEYTVKASSETDADAVIRQLQLEMLASERQLAARLASSYPEALIITDGQRPAVGAVTNVVGYLKTIHVLALSEAQLTVVRQLEAGQRSPLYLIDSGDVSSQKFEWFLRLRDPRPWLYSFAGMVRLQAHAGSDPQARLEAVVRLADWLAVVLPRYATLQHQDPRAPQQLLPIRALEPELRRRMGDAQLIRRRIVSYLQGLEG